MINTNRIKQFIWTLPLAVRLGLLAIAVGSLLLLAKHPMFFGVIGIIFIFTGLFRRARQLMYPVWRISLRRLWRIVRLFRSLLIVTPAVELLHITTALVMMLSVVFLVTTRDATSLNFLGTAALVTLIVAVVIDGVRQVTFLTRKIWARTIGKLSLAAIGTILYYVADAFARHVVHSITLADPKYFPDSVALLVSAATPLLYLALGSGLAIMWALVQFLALILIYFIWESANGSLLTCNSWRRIAHRIRYGNKLRQVSAQERDTGFILLMRPTGLVIAVSYLWSSIGQVGELYGTTINEALGTLVVAVEYRKGAPCQGVAENAEFGYLDSGSIAIYDPNGANGRKFSVRKCAALTGGVIACRSRRGQSRDVVSCFLFGLKSCRQAGVWLP